MPLTIQGSGGSSVDAGGNTMKALKTHKMPYDYGALGSYGYNVRIISTAAQAANSRIFELRNGGGNVIICHKLRMRAIQVAAGTAQENSLDVFRCTSFSAVDNTNTVTPSGSVKRSTMSAFPGNAQPRHLTVTGVAAGMTGGTLTKDGNAIATLPYNVAAAINTTTQWDSGNVFDEGEGGHPLVLANNEGFIIENRVLNVTSYGIAWYLDIGWTEATSF